MNNIHLNSQVIETGRLLSNATFTYDMHMAVQPIYTNGTVANRLTVVDGTGRVWDFGTCQYV